MEVSVNQNCSTALTASPPCITAIVPSKTRVSRMRKIASDCVFWIGMALIGIVAIPTGVLFGIICLIARTMNLLIDRTEKG